MSYPTVPITTLSDNARWLYRRAGTTLTLDRDWLQDHAHRMSPYASHPKLMLDPDFQPGYQLSAAVGELTAAGYLWHSHGNVFGVRRVDPEVYTIAIGDGPWTIEVSRVDRPGLTASQSEDGVLIAVLEGAELSTRSDSGFGSPELHLNVLVPGARDIEHDPAYAAAITLQLPTFPQIYGRRLIFWGVAETAHLYPLETDPTLLDDRTHEPIEHAVRCNDEHCQGGENSRDPHVFAPYLPPKVDLVRAVLCVEATFTKPRNKSKKEKKQ